MQEARKIISTARIIEGPVTALHDQPFWLCPREVKRPNDDEFRLLIEQQVTFRWDDQEADIGTMYMAA